MLDWNGVLENVIAAVAGAIILSLVYWGTSILKKRKKIEWYELERGSTTFDSEKYKTTVGYTTVVLINRAGVVVRDVEVLLSGPFSKISYGSSSKVEILEPREEARLKVVAVQPKGEMSIYIQSAGREYIRVKNVFVGDEDMGDEQQMRYVKRNALVVPAWIFTVLYAVAIVISLSSLFGTLSGDEQSIGRDASAKETRER